MGAGGEQMDRSHFLSMASSSLACVLPFFSVMLVPSGFPPGRVEASFPLSQGELQELAQDERVLSVWSLAAWRALGSGRLPSCAVRPLWEPSPQIKLPTPEML